MWFAKISIIFFLFAFAVLFFGYEFSSIFSDTCLTNTATYSDLNTFVTNFVTQAGSSGFNANLIFGDFLSTWTILKDVMTGTLIQESIGEGGSSVLACSGWGGIDATLGILVTATYYLSIVFLLVYIISFRSV